MFQAKATFTGCIGAIALAIALFSPTKEFTSADSLVGFASGDKVQTQTVQTNKGFLGFMLLATVGSAVWTFTGNEDEQAAPVEKKAELAKGERLYPPDEPANTPQTAATLNALKSYVTDSAKNLMVVATGGSGKGMALSNMCRWRSLADPHFVAVWCDPKNDADESGYFAHPSIRAFRFSGGKLSGPEIASKVRELLSQYRALIAELPPKTPVWLILDEWTFILAKLKKHDSALLDEVVDLLSSTISMLDAESKHIVLVGQSPLLKDLLPGEGGLAANLNTLFLFKRDDSAAKMIVKAGQASVIPGAIANQEALYNVCSYSPRERAMFFDGQLWPAPELQNFGNYDRDDREHLGKPAANVTNYADQTQSTLAAPIEFDPDAVKPSPNTAETLTSLYERSPSAAKPLHPKVKHFADVVARYWEKNPEDSRVSLGRIIQFDHKLKATAGAEGRALIEKVMMRTAALNLIQTEREGDNWHIVKLDCLDDFGDSGF